LNFERFAKEIFFLFFPQFFVVNDSSLISMVELPVQVSSRVPPHKKVSQVYA
jgi:hypothetical protein